MLTIRPGLSSTTTRMLAARRAPFFRYFSSSLRVSSAREDLIGVAKSRDPNQPEFLQAVEEVVDSVSAVVDRDPIYAKTFERLLEPERAIQFRVPWVDRNGDYQVNRGFRVQFNSAIGPYKGGLRFHPSVNLSVIKFLGFEQIFKNALTTLPLGGGKGGSDFDPKGKTDAEVMSFCQNFMTSLYRHIGEDVDVPAGDIGVGAREIGYMFGMYKRLHAGKFVGVLTGKGAGWGGSLIRPEATGYGTVYYADNILQDHMSSNLTGKRCAISGSGNVAQYAVEKLLDFGAIPITLSDSAGTIVEPEGFTRQQLAHVMELKNVKRGRIREYTEYSPTAVYLEGKRPWGEACDFAFPCATQNEIDQSDAESLASNGCKGVFEGANMPSTPAAIKVFQDSGICYGPAKAANAGGVAISGIEMAQNSQRLSWTREQVDAKLKDIMKSIYVESRDAAQQYGVEGNFMHGANIAAFKKVADAMIDQGCV